MDQKTNRIFDNIYGLIFIRVKFHDPNTKFQIIRIGFEILNSSRFEKIMLRSCQIKM